MGAELITREGFLMLCKKNKPPQALVEQFKADIRGNDTLQIILVCEFFYKLIWFGYGENELERARSRKPEASKLVCRSYALLAPLVLTIRLKGADYWDEGLKDAIEAGDRE